MSLKIDCHIHIGKWSNRLYQPRQTTETKEQYEESYPTMTGIFMPSDQKDNFQKELRQTKHRWWWLDPYGKKFPDKLPDNVVGYKVHAGIDRAMGGITNDAYRPMISDAAELCLPVLVHCGVWEATSSYKWLCTAAEANTDVQFIAAHCGGGGEPNMFDAVAAFSKHPNIAVDTSSVKYIGVIQFAISVLGTERILFGSDWPVMPPSASEEVIRASVSVYGNNQEIIDSIMYKNATRLILRT